MKILVPLLYFTVYFSEISTFWVSRRLLNDGHTIPRIGFGTQVKVSNLDKVEQATIWAIESGYRLINTAAVDGSEAAIGRGIRNVTCRGIVKREEIFIATKLNIAVSTREEVIPELRNALRRLQLQYLDLFSIHVPFNMFNATNFCLVEIWRGMEDAKKIGLTKSIGVSNFNSTHITHILRHCQTRPAVNEIEVSPTFANLEQVAYCQSENIMTMSYAPLGRLVLRQFPKIISKVFEDPILTNISKKYGKNDIQVALRYLMDRSTIPTPGSLNKDHIQSNHKVSDFHLTQEELYTINDLDQNFRLYDVDEKLAIPQLQNFYNQTKGFLGDQPTPIHCNKTRRFLKKKII